MNILILFETSLITVDKIQIASGAQPRGKRMLYCNPTKSEEEKKIVDTIIAKVLCDLPFSRNRSLNL
jgi:hypothetical protein